MNLYLYLDKDTPIHRMDPRAKLFVLLFSFALPLLNQHPLWVAGAFAVILAYGAAARSLENLRRIRQILFFIFIFSTLVWTFFAKGTDVLIWRVSRQSILYGIGTGLKLDAMIIAGMVFLSTTKNEEISQGLILLGLPYPMAFAFSTALRLVPTFVGAGATIAQAQRSRGLDIDSGSFIERVRKYIPLLVPIFLTAIRSSDGLAMALEGKGFGASTKRTFYLRFKWTARETVVVGLFLALVVANTYLTLTGRTLIRGLMK
ncbi:MAG: energy-coupling factor transporter transmembrane component T [Bacillota bacterium]|nr:energy-coupling factor transporter transmembrane component T [Bacillota bacterium]